MLAFMLALLSGITGSAQTSEVPLTFRGLRPTVSIMINGQGPFAFTIDTGAALQTDVSPALVERFKLTPSGKVRAGDPSGMNAMELDTVKIDSIKLGDVEFRNVTAVSRPRRPEPGSPQVDGVLGFPLFADYLLTLDYPGSRVRLTREALPAANGSDILNFDNSRGVPVIDFTVGDMKLKADLDSGNLVGGFILAEAALMKLRLSEPLVVVGRARTVNNEIEIKRASLQDTIRIGSYEFPHPTVTVPTIGKNANIGFVVLSEFVLSFDQKNKRLKLQKPKTESGATVAIPAAMKDYVGTYGERAITFEKGALFLQRRGGPRMKLIASGKDEFTLEPVPAARLAFVRDENGKVIQLRVLNQNGEWETSKKHQP